MQLQALQVGDIEQCRPLQQHLTIDLFVNEVALALRLFDRHRGCLEATVGFKVRERVQRKPAGDNQPHPFDFYGAGVSLARLRFR